MKDGGVGGKEGGETFAAWAAGRDAAGGSEIQSNSVKVSLQ